MCLAEQGRDVSGRVRAHQPIDAAMLETHILQPVEVAQQFPPFRRDASFTQEVVEMLLHREGQERAEHMARMAASDEWKIGRVRMIALVRKKRFSTCSKSR
jgi:uncharacterized protein Usg